MKGTEQLVQNGYLDPTAVAKMRKLNPDKMGQYGELKLGQTTFGVLQKYLDISVAEARGYHPKHWPMPKNLRLSKPDTLVVQGRSVVAVVENKSPGIGLARRGHLEQLQTYVLVAKAKVGILTDGTNSIWIHNLDPRRKNEIKIIKEQGLYYSRKLKDTSLAHVLRKLDYTADEITTPPQFDPSLLARSVWQDVYIATRQDPEKCFQTFVDIFMFKLLSDYGLLPSDLRIGALVVDPDDFRASHGTTQIEYYLNLVRPAIKSQLFQPMNTSEHIAGLLGAGGHYTSTKALIPTLDTSGGRTSVIDGHAFQTQPADYNDSFVGILRKFNDFPPIRKLDPGFKSRIYEQFLRKDPNTSKITGKYLTPRNVVKAIVRMAEIGTTAQGTVIGDPACGVGGFITESILELERNGIPFCSEVNTGQIEVSRKLVGLEVLEDVVCLAKANMLLHCIEVYNALSASAKKVFTLLLSDVFVHCHEDRSLGSLRHPCVEAFDVIMANPPYIVSGTKSVTTKLNDSKELAGFYDSGGSGLESRFVNWIVNAVKRGGKAFIILPKSMLARVDKKFKQWIRTKCIIDALVYLPENTFYTTPNPTYIVALTRKNDDNLEQHAPVFCYYVRDTGETRDVKRDPTRNDLVEMADEYMIFKGGKSAYEPATDFCKKIPIETLVPSKRWDVDYLWSAKELAELGVVDTNVRPYRAIILELESAEKELLDAAAHIRALVTKAEKYRSLGLGDKDFFKIHRGSRVTSKQCKEHPGDVPVVSSGRHEISYLGTISDTFLKSKHLPVFGQSDKIMTVGATGAVGRVHIRREPKWFLHDDALGVEVVNANLLPRFVRCALQEAIDVAKFEYTAKLFTERLKALAIRVPVDKSGGLDTKMQQQIASAYDRKESVETRLKEVAEHLRNVTVEFAG